MADKGFTIGSELKELGLSLNIPPFSASGSQMSAADSYKTLKIAKLRVHIERLIAKSKPSKYCQIQFQLIYFKVLTKYCLYAVL